MMTPPVHRVIIALLCWCLCCCYANALASSASLGVSGAHSTKNQDNNSNNNNQDIRQRRSDQQPFAAASPPPKLVQWAKEAVQYYEGSTLVLSCSLATSISSVNNVVKFGWFKQGKPLASSNLGPTNRLSVETLADYSFLRLSQLKSSDSGAYTCVASNSQGQEDRTTAQVIVNVKLRWLEKQSQAKDGDESGLIGGQHELVTVRAGQPVILECGAAAQPLPRIRWFRLAPPPGAGHQRQQQPMDSNPFLGSHNSKLGFRLDEAHIRSSLMQQFEDSPLASYHRIELTHTDELPSRSSRGNESKQWRFETHSSGLGQHEMYSRLLLDRAEASNNGLYECEASSAASSELVPTQQQQQQQQQVIPADRLRKFFGVLVNGK